MLRTTIDSTRPRRLVLIKLQLSETWKRVRFEVSRNDRPRGSSRLRRLGTKQRQWRESQLLTQKFRTKSSDGLMITSADLERHNANSRKISTSSQRTSLTRTLEPVHATLSRHTSGPDYRLSSDVLLRIEHKTYRMIIVVGSTSLSFQLRESRTCRVRSSRRVTGRGSISRSVRARSRCGLRHETVEVRPIQIGRA